MKASQGAPGASGIREAPEERVGQERRAGCPVASEPRAGLRFHPRARRLGLGSLMRFDLCSGLPWHLLCTQPWPCPAGPREAAEPLGEPEDCQGQAPGGPQEALALAPLAPEPAA